MKVRWPVECYRPRTSAACCNRDPSSLHLSQQGARAASWTLGVAHPQPTLEGLLAGRPKTFAGVMNSGPIRPSQPENISVCEEFGHQGDRDPTRGLGSGGQGTER